MHNGVNVSIENMLRMKDTNKQQNMYQSVSVFFMYINIYQQLVHLLTSTNVEVMYIVLS